MSKMSKIESKVIGTMNEQAIHLIRLGNNKNMSIDIASYGAAIKSIYVPDDSGKIENIILGYDKIEDYMSDKKVLGATIKPYDNGISNVSFVIDENTYSLDNNHGFNCN
ncbi:MAG: hypothetical protein PHU69_14715 [Fermentimonas sp.]|nr:hypothetical protein [Fermentimonas sp.]